MVPGSGESDFFLSDPGIIDWAKSLNHRALDDFAVALFDRSQDLYRVELRGILDNSRGNGGTTFIRTTGSNQR